MNDSERQLLLDEEHLRLLRLGYLITGTVTAVFSLFPLLYVGFGMLFVSSINPTRVRRPGDIDPRTLGVLIAVFGGLLCAFFVLGAVLKLLTARALRLRRNRTLCLIAAAVSCLGIPYGTVLGILTFSVLSRPSVSPCSICPCTAERSGRRPFRADSFGLLGPSALPTAPTEARQARERARRRGRKASQSVDCESAGAAVYDWAKSPSLAICLVTAVASSAMKLSIASGLRVLLTPAQTSWSCSSEYTSVSTFTTLSTSR